MWVTLDYSLSTERVFIDVARYMYNTVGSTALCLCGIQNTDAANLPSWAPDWNQSFSSPLRSLNLDQDDSGPEFDASGPDPVFDAAFEGRRMHLKGVRIDSIGHTVNTNFYAPRHTANADQVGSWLFAYSSFIWNFGGKNHDLDKLMTRSGGSQ